MRITPLVDLWRLTHGADLEGRLKRLGEAALADNKLVLEGLLERPSQDPIVCTQLAIDDIYALHRLVTLVHKRTLSR